MINSDKIKSFEFIDPCLCNAWVATAVVGSAVIGGISQSYAASKAADAQTNASNKAIAFQQNQYDQTRTDLAPYRTIGGQSADQLTSRMGDLTSPTALPEFDNTLPTFDNSLPIAPNPLTQAELEATPGYEFTLAQGLKSTQNSAAARGLGTSGAALKGAATFATGLSDSTYNTRWQQRQGEFANQEQLFANRQTNNQNNQTQFANRQVTNANRQTTFADTMANKSTAYDRLKGLIDTGAGAAGTGGALGEKAAYNSGVATVGAGVAQGAADNKIGTSIANTASGIGGYAAYKGMYGSGSGGGSGPITYGTPNGPTAFS